MPFLPHECRDITRSTQSGLIPSQAWRVFKLSLSRRPLGPSLEACHFIQNISEHQGDKNSHLPSMKHSFCVLEDPLSINIPVYSFHSSLSDTAIGWIVGQTPLI